MSEFADKKRKDILYKIEDKIFLFNEEHRHNETVKEAELQNDRVIQDHSEDRRQL